MALQITDSHQLPANEIPYVASVLIPPNHALLKSEQNIFYCIFMRLNTADESQTV